MTTEFDTLNLNPQLIQAVMDAGYTAPMPIQSAIIPLMLRGEDVIGQAQTGTGKTAAFALPILHNIIPHQEHIQALILAPTRELAIQVSEAIHTYGQHSNVRVLPVYGGQAYNIQIRQLRRGVDIVVGTPGRLMDLMDRKLVDLSQVRTVVLDEADEMLSMGFIEDIETILAATPARRQTALFSATISNEIRRLADQYMITPHSVTIQREQVTVDAIEQRYYLVNEPEKTAALTRLFETEEITSALIFARTRSGTGELANELNLRGFPAEVLNGDLSQEAREHTMTRFRANQIKVLVATDVAARGLDIDGISHVFNFDLPDDPEIYVHRIGRTGRAGKTGIAITLVTPAEKRRLGFIERFTRRKLKRAELPTEAEIRARREARLVGQMMMWLQRGRCKQERELAEKLALEGYDAMDIAAAALKMARAEEKQRPIAAITAVPEPTTERVMHPQTERRLRFERSQRTRNPHEFSHERTRRTVSHEEGMVRLSLNKGKKHGVRPNDIVGAIAAHANIPGSIIGKIHIQEKHSTVDVPEGFVRQILAKTGEVTIRKQPVSLARAE